nr:(2Fe-2S)-binding protein [Rhodococcus sp. HNM0569]
MRALLDARTALWGSPDPRTTASLWWYAASWLLVRGPIETRLRGGAEVATLDSNAVTAPSGYLSDVGPATPTDDAAVALLELLAPLVDALADAGGPPRRVLWALVTDSVANCALAAAPRDGVAVTSRDGVAVTSGDGVAVANLWVSELHSAGAALPTPRFEVVDGRVLTRRSSCCLIYRVGPREHAVPMCTSCPKRHPDDRHARLSGN